MGGPYRAHGALCRNLAWTGTIRGEELRYEQQKEISGRRRILLDRTSGSYYMDMEEYLPGVIARQIPVEYEPEALKARPLLPGHTYAGRWRAPGMGRR
mgnify:CR=1 FL=1